MSAEELDSHIINARWTLFTHRIPWGHFHHASDGRLELNGYTFYGRMGYFMGRNRRYGAVLDPSNNFIVLKEYGHLIRSGISPTRHSLHLCGENGLRGWPLTEAIYEVMQALGRDKMVVEDANEQA